MLSSSKQNTDSSEIDYECQSVVFSDFSPLKNKSKALEEEVNIPHKSIYYEKQNDKNNSNNKDNNLKGNCSEKGLNPILEIHNEDEYFNSGNLGLNKIENFSLEEQVYNKPNNGVTISVFLNNKSPDKKKCSNASQNKKINRNQKKDFSEKLFSAEPRPINSNFNTNSQISHNKPLKSFTAKKENNNEKKEINKCNTSVKKKDKLQKETHLYIQTELCQQTLEEYLEKRDKELKAKKNSLMTAKKISNKHKSIDKSY